MIFSSNSDKILFMTNDSKKVLLSGVQATGRPHLGNYFGMMKQTVDLQEEYDSRVFIADLHSITKIHNGNELSQNTLELAINYLAIGLDPKNVLIFKQSDMPEVTELAWIFNCITTMPYLMRAHAFKDSEAKNKEVNVGLFDYPILMAADILIHNADIVPVGKDQRQHVEMARDIAEKFNREFLGVHADSSNEDKEKAIFKLPEAMILEEVETVPGIDGQKMSKSYNNHIPLFAEDEELKKLVMAIVTDSGSADEIASGKISGIPENVYNIHKLIRDKNSLDAFYEENKGKYKILKDELLKDLIAFITPLRERREKIAKDPEAVKKMLKNNGERAKELTADLMSRVRKAVGLEL